MDPTSKAFAMVFLVATMLGIGMKVTAADLASTVRNRGWMARMLAANFLLIPSLGLLLAVVIPMRMDVKIGFLLVAVAPGGLNAIQFTSKTNAGLCYAVAALLILSFLSILVSPLVAAAVIPVQTPLVLSYEKIASWLLLGVVLPLLAGLAMHHGCPRIAGRLAKPFAAIGTVAFFIVVLLLLERRRQAQAVMTASELASMLVFVLGSMGIGWVLGGPGREMRRILATGSSMRNAGMGFLIATNSFPNSNVVEAVIAFSTLMIPLNMLLTVYGLVRDRRARPAGAANQSVT